MSRINSLRKGSPETLSNPEIFDIAEQADKLQELKALYDTEGGKQLVNLLLSDVVYSVKTLCSNYRTTSHTELIAIIAKMSSDLDTASVLIGAKEGMEILDEELDKALRE